MKITLRLNPEVRKQNENSPAFQRRVRAENGNRVPEGRLISAHAQQRKIGYDGRFTRL
jgi:hypothetical protein